MSTANDKASGQASDWADEREPCPQCYHTTRRHWLADPTDRGGWMRLCDWCGDTLRGWRAMKAWAMQHDLPLDRTLSMQENIARWPVELQRLIDSSALPSAGETQE